MAEIAALPLTLRARYFHLADRMEMHGPDLGMPHTRAMGGGLLEMRLKGREGIARIFYCALTKARNTRLIWGIATSSIPSSTRRPTRPGLKNCGKISNNGEAMAKHAHQIAPEALKPFAKYIWWKAPDEAVAFPARVIAQVMDIGDYFDVQALAHLVGDDVLCEVLTHAEAGWFNERSWTYWHYRLGLAKVDKVPPLPMRRFQ